MQSSDQVASILEAAATSRVEAVGKHLGTVAGISRMVDQLCDLHGDLNPDDRLHQVLHALGFCWAQVESELVAVVKSRRN